MQANKQEVFRWVQTTRLAEQSAEASTKPICEVGEPVALADVKVSETRHFPALASEFAEKSLFLGNWSGFESRS